MYCNKMYWGHCAYGVEAASQLYFAKSAKDLTLDEAAMIAGIIQGNVRQSPYVNMEAAVRAAQLHARSHGATKATSPPTRRPPRRSGRSSRAASRRSRDRSRPYFLETVRTQLEERYGAKAVYEGGLVVKTGLDPALQRAANRALDERLRELDKQRGYRRAGRQRALRDGEVRSTTTGIRAGAAIRSTATSCRPSSPTSTAAPSACASAQWRGTIDRKGYEWTKQEDRRRRQRRGDLIEVGSQARSQGHVHGHARTDAAARRRRPRDRQPHRADPGDDRRRQLRAQPVQPRDAGDAPGRVALQAVRLHGGDRPRLDGAAPRSIDEPVSVRRRARTSRRTSRRTTTTSSTAAMTLRTALEQSRNVPTIKLMDELGPPTRHQLRARPGHHGAAAAVPVGRRSARPRARCSR